jgi:hypothetical protein
MNNAAINIDVQASLLSPDLQNIFGEITMFPILYERKISYTSSF